MHTDMTDPSDTSPPPLNCTENAVFLDFDGTLVEIAPTPDAVKVPPELGTTLSTLQAACGNAVAIVSGRSLHDLENFLPDFAGILVGSHGSEARGMAPPMHHLPRGLPEIQQKMRAFTEANGLYYEHKSHGCAIHFRSNPEAGEKARTFIGTLLRHYPGYQIQPAKMAFEIRPEGFSKDGALAALMKLPDFAGRAPVYLGDDATDEPALSWVQTHTGYGIKVGPGESAARFRLNGPAEVYSWIKEAAEH